MVKEQKFVDEIRMSVGMSLGEDVTTSEKHAVTGFPGCLWFLQVKRYFGNKRCCIIFQVSRGPIRANLKLKCDEFCEDALIDFKTMGQHEVNTETVNMYEDLSITCNVEFCFETPHSDHGFFMHPHELVDPTWLPFWNTELVVGNERLKVHRGFLSMISPVFDAMFGIDSKEAKSGVVEIDDMDFAIVKNAIDFCLGRDVEEKSIEEYLGIHQFCDKYGIVTATERIEKYIFYKMTVDNLSKVIEYAWQYSQEKLQEQCGQFYYENFAVLAFHPSMMNLSKDNRVGITDAAYAIQKEATGKKEEKMEPDSP